MPNTANYGPMTMDPYAVDEQSIQRQRQIAQALMAQGMKHDYGSTPMVGNMAVRRSPLEGLAGMLQAWNARKMLEGADERQKSIQQQRMGDFQSDMQAVSQAAQGTPEIPAPSEEAGGGPGRPAMPGSKQAMIAAMLSGRSPQIQQMGMQLQTQELMRDPSAAFGKINPHDYTPESLRTFMQGGGKDFSSLVPVRKQEVAPSGVVYNPYAVQPGTVFNDPNKLVAIGPNGVPVLNQQLFGAKKELAHAGAPKTSVTVATDSANKAFIEDLAKRKPDALGFAQSIQNAQNVRRLLDEGKIQTGPGSSVLVALSEYLPVGGKTTQEKIANTRILMQQMGNEVLTNAHFLKPMSNSDIKVVQDIIGANPNLSAETIRRGMELYEASKRAQLASYNKDAGQLRNKIGDAGFDYGVPEPSEYSYRPIGVGNVIRFDVNGNPVK